jgi:hypothetical protein
LDYIHLFKEKVKQKMLSDKIKHVKSPKNRALTAKGCRYSDSQKLEAVKLWLITGNMAHTAAGLNIPLITIRSWRGSNWWDGLVADVRSENQITLSNKLRKIVEKSHEALLDRIVDGDYVFGPDGDIIRKPIQAKDLNLIAKDSLDRHLKLEKKPHEEEVTQKISDRLASLADAFTKLAGKRTQVVNVTDVIYMEDKNALYEEREEGLQEGEGLGTLDSREVGGEQEEGTSPA